MEHDTGVIVEESSRKYTVTWIDSDGDPVQPIAVTWTLTDRDGTVINSRSGVSETPGLTNTITLGAADLALADQTNDFEYRVLTVHGDEGNASIPIIVEIDFIIRNNPSIT
jgi:hypothetical protein